MRYLIICLLFLSAPLPATLFAETMTGMITDLRTGKPMPYVGYENVYSHVGGVTDSSGTFAIVVAKGELVEFRKMGYKTERVRVPAGIIPPYFKIQMQEAAYELAEIQVYDRYRNFKNDSQRNYELYKQAIEYQKLSGYQVIQHPFTAMSKHYQRIMSFQREYEFLEKMRYVDYAFSEHTISKLTGLSGDDLNSYMRVYRPSYEQLRSMSDYAFYAYIKETAVLWTKRKAR